MHKVYLIVDSSSTAQAELGPLCAKGLVGAANGFHFVAGGAIVTVRVYDPAALDEIDANPKLTRLPSPVDPTPDAVKQSHVDKLPTEIKERLKANGKLDNNHKLKDKVTGRELAQHLHDQYRAFTSYLHPDF